MAEFNVKDIQRLRQSAGVGMMDAKKALTAAEGDFDAAFLLLREQGLAAAAKRAEREAREGTIGSYLHVQNSRPVVGVLVELSCETDFVAKSPEFNEVAGDIAMHISWADPGWIRREDVPGDVVEAEAAIVVKQAEAEGKPAHVVERIVAGKMEAWYADNVLYDQVFVNAEKFAGTVGEYVGRLGVTMGENISVRHYARLAVGQGS